MKPLAAREGMLWGKPHLTCPQKTFENRKNWKNFWKSKFFKKLKFKIRKILIFVFCPLNCTDRPNFIPGGAQNSF